MGDRPPLVAVEGEGEPVEDLEGCFLREAVVFADDWLRKLPASSQWYGPCLTVRQCASRALGRRRAWTG